jgi:hypothetical protein
MSTIPSHLIDVFSDEHDGYPDELSGEDTRDVLWETCGSASRDFPKEYWIEPKEWEERARYNTEYNLWPVNYLDRFTNQGAGNGRRGTHECTTHMLRACMESCRNRTRRIALGPPEDRRLEISAQSASVWLSCLSVYAEANPGKWGGANVRQVLEIATRRGMLPDKIQPRPWKFKHNLAGTNGAGNVNQSSGDWVAVEDFPDGWETTARHFRPLEVIFPDSWEQMVCLVLNSLAVGMGRRGHAMPYTRWYPDEKVLQCTDSYNRFTYDSIRTIKQALSGSFAIASVTLPDSWDVPAGDDMAQ